MLAMPHHDYVRIVHSVPTYQGQLFSVALRDVVIQVPKNLSVINSSGDRRFTNFSEWNQKSFVFVFQLVRQIRPDLERTVTTVTADCRPTLKLPTREWHLAAVTFQTTTNSTKGTQPRKQSKPRSSRQQQPKLILQSKVNKFEKIRKIKKGF